MKARTHRRLAPTLKPTTVGTPATGDFCALAELLVKLDARPPVKLVAPPTKEKQT